MALRGMRRLVSCNYRWHGDHAILKAEASGDAVGVLKEKRRGAVEGWTQNTGWLVLATHDGEKIVWNHEAIEQHLEGRNR